MKGGLCAVASVLAVCALARPFLVFNEDDSHYFCRPESTTREGLRAYVDDVCRGAVTHFFICANGQRAIFDSKTIDSAWKDNLSAKGYAANLKKLNESGIDPIRFWCDCCREKKVSPWVSIRMNDVHCVNEPNHPYLSSFWRKHPELWRGGPNAEPGMLRAFNYRYKEVRDYFLAFVREVADRYECADGIELDWLRFTEHLTPGKEKDEAAFLTAFVREASRAVRESSARRGRPLRLAVRVATTPEAAQGYGMDVVAWAREGLVDLVIPHNYRYEPDFNLPLDRWTTLLKAANPAVRVLPGCDSSIKIDHLAPDRKMNLAEFCGWADVMWSRGAKGLYLFNLYENPPDCEVWNEILTHGLAADYVAAQRRRYPLTYLDTPGGGTSGRQLPADLTVPRTFTVYVGAKPDRGVVSVFLAFDGPVAKPLLKGILLNGIAAIEIVDEPLANWVEGYRSNMHSITWATLPQYAFKLPHLKSSMRCTFPVTAVQTDANRISVPAATATAKLMALELEIDPSLIALGKAVVTNGIKWIDGTLLPLEGCGFDDVERPYDRFPTNVTKAVNPGILEMRHDTTGMQFRFATDSTNLHFRWTPYNSRCYADHMPATCHSGIDVYRFDREKNKWLYVKTGRPRRVGEELTKDGSLDIPWIPGTPCLVNLPAYNGIRSFSLGIDPTAKLMQAPPHRGGVSKPVVFYGTSITHGGCASRPGMTYPAIVGRDLDVPIVNLGFSGCGRMELEMAEHIARIDASCYVLDCLWNMNCCRQKPGDPCEDDLVAAGITGEFSHENRMKFFNLRYEKFLRILRARRPDVPIVLAEQCDVYCGGPSDKDLFIRGVYEKLVAAGWKGLVYLPKTHMYADDLDGCVDGSHPNDYGMKAMAAAFAGAVRQALAPQEPLFRVGIMTDTHIEDNPATTNRLAGAYRLFKSKGVSMIVNCGDIADYYSPKAYAHYRSVRESTYPNAASAPVELYAWAGHDHFRFPDKTEPGPWTNAFAHVKPLLGIQHDMYADIEHRGFRFLVVPQVVDYERYRNMLRKACRESPGRPVFVIDHVPSADTTENVAHSGDPQRRALLAEFPQAVVFTGHAHTSLYNERNIWQGPFTTVSAGGLADWAGDFVGEVLWPMYDSHDVLVMEVFEKKAVLRRFDVHTGREIGADAPWTLEWPYDPARPVYSPERRRARSTRPAFPAAAEIDFRESPTGQPFALTVSFPPSVATNTVRSYRLTLERPNGSGAWETFARQEIPAGYNWMADRGETRASYTFTGGYFVPRGTYRISATPVDIWGNVGNPIHRAWTAPDFKRTIAWRGLPENVSRDRRFVIKRYDEIRLNLPETLRKDVLTPRARVRVAVELEVDQGNEAGVTFSLFGNTDGGRYPWCLTTPAWASRARYAFDVTLPKRDQTYSLAFRHGVSGWFAVKGVSIEKLGGEAP